MDDYPAADPFPDLDETTLNAQHNELIQFLTNSREMRQTARSSLKQAAWAGSGALAGGFLLGPVGGMVGGIVGSVVGFIKADEYDGAVLEICKLDETHKKQLLTKVGQVLIMAGATASQLNTTAAFHETLVHLASSRSVRDDLWNACLDSLQN